MSTTMGSHQRHLAVGLGGLIGEQSPSKRKVPCSMCGRLRSGKSYSANRSPGRYCTDCWSVDSALIKMMEGVTDDADAPADS